MHIGHKMRLWGAMGTARTGELTYINLVFPTPGGPVISVTCPVLSPPPSTSSRLWIPVERRVEVCCKACDKGIGRSRWGVDIWFLAAVP